MEWDFPEPYTHDIVVSATDIDGMGHTNNACYVVWCESVAWGHSASLGLTVEDYKRLNRGVAIQSAHYDYFQPSFAGQAPQIGTWITGCDGKLRLQRSFQVIAKGTAITVMRGRWTLVCINVMTGKPSRFPTVFLDIYGTAALSSELADQP